MALNLFDIRYFDNFCFNAIMENGAESHKVPKHTIVIFLFYASKRLNILHTFSLQDI